MNQKALPVKLNTIEVMGILPHRYPFLLVDKVLEIKRNNTKNRVGHEITAIKSVTVNEPFFQGHFPDQPIMPGVLIIECMAQACGVLAYKPHPTNGTWKFYILGIDQARFRKPVLPGDTMTLKGKMLKDRSNILSFECQAFVEGELAAEAQVLAQMVP